MAIQSQNIGFHNAYLSQSKSSGKTTTLLTIYYYCKILNVLSQSTTSPVFINLQDQRNQISFEFILANYLKYIPTNKINFEQKMKDFVGAGFQFHKDIINYQNTVVDYIFHVVQKNKEQIQNNFIISFINDLINIQQDFQGFTFINELNLQFIHKINDELVFPDNDIYLLIDQALFNSKRQYSFFLNQITLFTHILFDKIRKFQVLQMLNQKINNFFKLQMHLNKIRQTSCTKENSNTANTIENSNTQYSVISMATNQPYYSQSDISSLQLEQSEISMIVSEKRHQEISSSIGSSRCNLQFIDIIDQLYLASPLCFQSKTRDELKIQFCKHFQKDQDFKNILFTFCLELYNPRNIELYILKNIKEQVFQRKHTKAQDNEQLYIQNFFEPNNEQGYYQFKCYSIYTGTDLTMVNSINISNNYRNIRSLSYTYFQLLGQVQCLPSELAMQYYTESQIFLNNDSKLLINEHFASFKDNFNFLLLFYILQPEIAFQLQLVSPLIIPALFFKIETQVLSINTNTLHKLCKSKYINNNVQLQQFDLYLQESLKYSCNGLKSVDSKNKELPIQISFQNQQIDVNINLKKLP